jgi:opacity protein-like surface antigen
MKTMIIAGLSILALTATAASAQTTGAAATSGTYGSIGILNDHNTRTDTDLGGVNLRLGQRFNQNWGVEGEAAFGTNTDSDAAGKYRLKDKVGVYGVGYVPVGQFDLFARAGLANTDQKRPDGTAKDESGTSLDYGVGAQYHMAPNYALRADWTQSDYTNDHGTANTATLSLVRQF